MPKPKRMYNTFTNEVAMVQLPPAPATGMYWCFDCADGDGSRTPATGVWHEWYPGGNNSPSLFTVFYPLCSSCNPYAVPGSWRQVDMVPGLNVPEVCRRG